MGRLSLLAAAVVLLGFLVAPAAAAPAAAERVAAQALESDSVYVHPRAARRLSVGDRGRIRLAIVDRAIGRMKIAVVPAGVARKPGGAAGFARGIDETLDARGALIVVAGGNFHAITSHPEPDAAAAALREAVSRHAREGLAAQLLDAVDRVAAVDPGARADVRPPGPATPGTGGDADDFLDDIKETFRLGVLIVAAAIALPFILVAIYLLARVRRRHAREEEAAELGKDAARDRLVTLGDGIRSLDFDTSMPGADRAGLADYEHALESYEQANQLLMGDPSDHRVQQARAAIEAGERHIEAARLRLG